MALAVESCYTIILAFYALVAAPIPFTFAPVPTAAANTLTLVPIPGRNRCYYYLKTTWFAYQT